MRYYKIILVCLKWLEVWFVMKIFEKLMSDLQSLKIMKLLLIVLIKVKTLMILFLLDTIKNKRLQNLTSLVVQDLEKALMLRKISAKLLVIIAIFQFLIIVSYNVSVFYLEKNINNF